MHSQGVVVKSSPPPPQAFARISDRDLTEIELHSVDSISDLHRIHSEQHSKGSRPPRPQPPTINGNLQTPNRLAVCQTGHQIQTQNKIQLNNPCISFRRCYTLACVAILLILLTLILICSYLVQQSNTLSEVVKQRKQTADEISLLIQELQALRRNLTTLGNRH